MIVLALGLVFVSYKWIGSTAASTNETVQKQTIGDILTRTSVRAYSDRKVEDEKIAGKINSWLIFDIFGQEVVDKFKNLQRWFSLIESS